MKKIHEKIYEFILEFYKTDEFNKNKFSLKNADVKYINDKNYIENEILNKYKTIEEYEKRINIYIYLILYRNDLKYVYLANKIMNF